VVSNVWTSVKQWFIRIAWAAAVAAATIAIAASHLSSRSAAVATCTAAAAYADATIATYYRAAVAICALSSCQLHIVDVLARMLTRRE